MWNVGLAGIDWNRVWAAQTASEGAGQPIHRQTMHKTKGQQARSKESGLSLAAEGEGGMEVF